MKIAKMFTIALVGVLAALAIETASAQPVGVRYASNGTNALNGGTNNFTHNTTTTFTGYTINVSEFDHVGVSLSTTLNGAGTDNSVAYWARSKDGGATYETVPSISQVVANNGTTAVVTTFDVATYSDTHLKLVKVVSTNSTYDGTNFVVKYQLKAHKQGVFSVTK